MNMRHSLWRALRPVNLLMVAVTQAVCWRWLNHFLPELKGQSSSFQILLVVGSTVCITAAGYLINDYYDRAIDILNKPQKALPASPETGRKLLWLYVVLNVLGFLLAIPPALACERPYLLLIQVGTILLLWLYSAYWKRLPVVGNIVVALLTAMSIWMLCLYNGAIPVLKNDVLAWSALANAFRIMTALSVFAFLLTWIREMVKDIEDLEGDRAEGCRTLPIVWGIERTRLLTGFLTVMVIIALALCAFYAKGKMPLFSLLSALLAGVTFAWLIFLQKAQTKIDFHRLSAMLKLLMLGGLVLLWTV